MEVILLKDVEKVGRKGDVLRVRDGFGRNFLLPQGFALLSTRSNQKFIEEQKARTSKRRSAEKQKAEDQAEKLKELKLTVEAAAGEQDKLFGSVTADDIREALAKKGYLVDKKHIHLKEAIRTLGVHTASVEIYPQVKANISIEVIRKA